MIILDCFGGLGNQLYHIALFEYLKQAYAYRKISLKFTTPVDRHINVSYFDSIFKNWKEDVNNSIVYTNQVIENNLNPIDVLNISEVPTLLWGYFQTYKYVTESFKNKLTFSNEVATKYADIGNMIFIHIRGGDYLEQRYSVHNIDLKTYYEEAIKRFDKNSHFCIFTNDITYAKSFDFLNTIDHIFIEETPVDSLYLMSKCKGGICANSTFSWWGAYLNPKRKLILPSNWYNDSSMYTGGYYFPEATVVSVEKDIWPFIDKVVYINLDHRTDRNEHMKDVISVFNNKSSRYPAIKTSYGLIGCVMSHIEVLRDAINKNYKNILILEDDAEWNNFEDGYNILKKLASSPYDVILLGGSFVSCDPVSHKLFSAQTTTAYLVNNHYFQTLLNNFMEGLKYLLVDTSKHEHYALDIYWKQLQARDNWFVVYPPLIYQQPSYSDICNGHVDYRSLMNINTEVVQPIAYNKLELSFVKNKFR
jgi:glycosyl transferase family 25